MDKIEPQIDIYIGHLIDNESDQIALKEAVEVARGSNTSAAIMANVNFSGRQIDLIVATENQVLVVEAKKYSRPLRGSENGRWEFLSATNEWRTIGRNYYIQTLEAKNALHRSMQKFSAGPVDHPEAALLFVTGIPIGSEIPPGDFKVQIGDLSLLKIITQKKHSTSAWTLDVWRAFATKSNLIQIESLDSAFDSKLIQSGLLLDEYRKSFSDFYNKKIQSFLPFPCRFEGHQISSEKIEELMNSGKSMAIIGPSGCGKSMLSHKIGLSFVKEGGISVFVEAKDFEKEFRTLITKELALLVPTSLTNSIISSRQTLRAPLLIILDGFNECKKSLRQRLARCIRAMAIRYQASILVTSQDAPEDLQSLNLENLYADEPDGTLKKSIADLAAGEKISSKSEDLLALARSGLEARIVGEISKTAKPGISRYGLFDSFIRKIFDDSAQEAIKMLSRIGSYLSENLCFSLSIRDFDRLGESFDWREPISRKLLSANVLSRRSDRISFGHELYLNAFFAESLLRACSNDADKIALELIASKHSNYKILILGAIDNTALLDSVLDKISDFEIVTSCINGECGEYARQWMDRRCRDVLKKVEIEARSVVFKIDEDSWMGAAAEESSLIEWNEQEKELVRAISNLLGKGKYLDEVFLIAGIMDSSLNDAFRSLIEEAREKKIGLRGPLFRVGIADQNTPVSIGKIISRMNIDFFSNKDRYASSLNLWVKSVIDNPGISNGQIFMVLQVCKSLYDDNPINHILPALIRDRWKYAPYHLRIDLLDAVYRSHSSSEEQRNELIEAISAIETDNIWISSSIIDALKSLDAIEDAGYEETVIQEIEQIFSDAENPENWALASSLYVRQFDHPYESTYWEVLHALPDLKRKQFLSLAVRSKDDFRMFACSMIIDLAAFGDPSTGKYLEHWTDLPPEDCSMPQEAVGAFVASHIVLARLQHPMPPKDYGDSAEHDAMRACGEIYYWSNRSDLSWSERLKSCNDAWEKLLNVNATAALSAIKECEATLREGIKSLNQVEPEKTSIASCFPKNLVEISRKTLGTDIVLYPKDTWMNRKQIELLCFAIGAIGSFGESIDLALLRSKVNHSDLGNIALKAIRRLEDRTIADDF